VLERLNDDLLDPMTNLNFTFMQRQGWIPEPPPELQGQPLRVEYTSIMAQAQKLIGTGTVERFFGFAAQAASINPDTLDKVDMDQMIDVYGDLTGVNPGIVRSDDAVAQIRQQRQQQLAAQAKMNVMQQSAQTAKDLSQAEVTGDNALSRVLEGSM